MEKEVKTRFTTLYILPEAMKRISYYAQAAVGEVSGLGTVIRDDKGRHIVNKVYLLEQESSAADTELKPEAISKLMVDMMKENQDPGTLKFWWHSHANMGVFWSGTDDTCAETLSREYAFSLVVNKAGEKKCRLDLYTPFRIIFDGVKVEELAQDDVKLKEECEKEVKEKVKTPYEKYTYHGAAEYGSGYDSAYHGNWQGGYHGRRGFGVHHAADHLKSRITLPEQIVSDIEDFMTEATTNANDGGIFSPVTWNNFRLKIMKDVLEKRYDKKSGCTQFGSYDADFDSCKDKKKCEVIAKCQFWTKFLQECEKDANDAFTVEESGEITKKDSDITII